MEILKQTRNNLLNRTELKGIVKSQGNLGYSNATRIVAEKLKAQEENIAIKTVKGRFGRDDFLIDAMIYDTKEDKEKIEPKSKQKKGEGN
jgi:ribosomal protein S24E